MNETAARWRDACLAAALFAVAPAALGGVLLRSGAGPARDRWAAALGAWLPEGAPMRRMPHGIADERLLGGLDLTATLRLGCPVAQRGLLAEADGGVLLLPMAERLPPGTAARLASAMDRARCRWRAMASSPPCPAASAWSPSTRACSTTSR